MVCAIALVAISSVSAIRLLVLATYSGVVGVSRDVDELVTIRGWILDGSYSCCCCCFDSVAAVAAAVVLISVGRLGWVLAIQL